MTKIIKISPKAPKAELIAEAAKIIRSGGTVAFPTETVYGLGANALDPASVTKIFEAKGRPTDNPLIIHIAKPSQLAALVKEVTPQAKKLIKAFWPGALTIVLKKNPKVPKVTTAGSTTVAVRCPAHPIAQALLTATKLPIAAPSANLSGRPSATTAQHVINDLAGDIDAIIDGGPTNVGLESTVLDLTTKTPTLLRPGSISQEQIEKIVGPIKVATQHGKVLKSPGLQHQHYAPKARVILLPPHPTAAQITTAVGKNSTHNIALILRFAPATPASDYNAIIIRGSLENYANKLFASLRTLDQPNIKLILVESVEPTGIGVAIMDRLTRAAS